VNVIRELTLLPANDAHRSAAHAADFVTACARSGSVAAFLASSIADFAVTADPSWLDVRRAQLVRPLRVMPLPSKRVICIASSPLVDESVCRDKSI
jgi:hypothetical protein